MNYPHDISFSPDGNYLAVANRKSSSVLIFKKNLHERSFDSTPLAVISGEASQVILPGAVAYSPTDNSLIVANGLTDNLTFYHYEDDHYDEKPYQVLQNPFLVAPDGLAMSSDGKLLAVTSHDSHAVVIFQKMNHSDAFNREPIQVISAEEGNFRYPHSLTFHPHTYDLAVSNSQGRKNVIFFTREDGQIYLNSPTPSMEVLEMYDESTIALLKKLQQEGGVKGVCFSPDGKNIAVVQNLCDFVYQLPNPVGVLAIYRISED